MKNFKNKIGHIVFIAIAMLAFTALTLKAAIPVEQLSQGVAFLRENNSDQSKYGTGFFVKHGEKLYLVTAFHVAVFLTNQSWVTIASTNGRPFTFQLKDLIPQKNPFKLSFYPPKESIKWIAHPIADVAVLCLDPNKHFIDDHLAGHVFASSWIERSKEAPARALTLTVIGFPFHLGVSEYFSPLSRETKTASGLLEMPWGEGDNKKISPFFITQDPSIGGFSGAPLFDTRLPYSSATAIINLKMGSGPRIVGLVHGTLSDSTGGKMGAIVPAFLILETLEQENTLSKQ
jgi:hypothetical protein